MNSGFRRVAPGLLVADHIKVTISHPDPCWLISNLDNTRILTDGAGSVPMFSNEAVARLFLEKTGIKEAKPFGPHSWDAVVDNLGETCHTAIIDHHGEEGFYQNAPLQKGI